MKIFKHGVRSYVFGMAFWIVVLRVGIAVIVVVLGSISHVPPQVSLKSD
jgi:hypothetical protein